MKGRHGTIAAVLILFYRKSKTEDPKKENK